jgi:hypothetical protein
LTHRHTNNKGGDHLSVVGKSLQDSLASVKSLKQRTNKFDHVLTNPHEQTHHQASANTDDFIFKRGDSMVAGLNCDAHGGPSEEIAKEMVYWENIPSDSYHVSPFKEQGVAARYITFEVGDAGWNRVRKTMETMVAFAVSSGRTLVLPPKQMFYSMSEFKGNNGKSQQAIFSLKDLFPLERVAWEHSGLEIITMQQFLEREAMAGNIRDRNGEVTCPPFNVTDWDGAWLISPLNQWLRNVTNITNWNSETCIAAFPKSSDPSDIRSLRDMKSSIDNAGDLAFEAFIGKPPAVDAPAVERMKEMLAGREELCIYDEIMQKIRFLHVPSYAEGTPGARWQVHFYAFLFFQDWRQDLWMKRFIRDHIRYVDAIQCAAARVVHALRQRSRSRGDPDGNFDCFHIRGGDVTNRTIVDANQIYEVARKKFVENATVFVVTGEIDRAYFDPLRNYYDVVFLSDFQRVVFGVNTNFHLVISQLVASRSRTFIGCFRSTFSGYINRLRGYHANCAKAPGYKHGIIASWYYAPADQMPCKRTTHCISTITNVSFQRAGD